MNFFKKLFGSGQKPVAAQSAYGPEEKFNQHLELLQRFKRTAYIPKVSPGPSEFSEHSKIGGLPYLRSEKDWPKCPNCKKHLQLFLQLNLSEIPEKKSDGLLQFFYCTSTDPLCEVDLEAFFAFSEAVVSRLIHLDIPSYSINPEHEDTFPEKRITGWEAVDDYPHYEDYDLLGIDSDLDDTVYDLMEERESGVPISGDKLFGWPFWVQGSEYPSDRKTGTQMELVFQFDSEVNLPHMFGDAGIGHLTQSPDNKQELAFGWACT